ncbi:hypothetical protein [Kitasatospora phosalacinea]|uniref:hypothetical protein n=1 Tax=Kitasatospora phosalacinea TaxID=2065 RepID=UPI000524197B|nr:hypothetical protein [Kitasatospora phosalacinea]
MTNPDTATTVAPDARAERRAKRIAKHLSSFAARHGGSAEGVVEYVGAIGTRIVLVGADGAWGDQVAPSYAIGRRAAELAGLTLREEFDGELGLKVKTGPYEWKRMAGIQI